ncbi:DegT/DnrJ/EryC1/StrS family aminotransferase [Thalassospira alkalitolerans]|uniref:DegT/DnrJ/EryC1/StrS family aminotransferase n=1 Tax=Thalassospira alkalitolerans TaxID=1293890 RepID=UPI003AA95A8F
MKKIIKFVDLVSKYRQFQFGFHEDLDRLVSSGAYILGDIVSEFEQALSDFSGVKHAIAVANGTDALVLSLRAGGVVCGDEVITTPMSYLASTSAIALCGAKAVFADVDETLNANPQSIESLITDKTKAILVVHLAGNPANLSEIRNVADRNGLFVIEDCAQALGASFAGEQVGSFGDFAGISFHPLKNLGALGDAGAVLTDNDGYAEWLRKARNHGHISREDCGFWSMNSRLDALQAAFLLRMLKEYPVELKRRRSLAGIYMEELSGTVEFQFCIEGAKPSYNWFILLAEKRADLMRHLDRSGVETKIHYPILIPDMHAAERLTCAPSPLPRARNYVEKILSLPCGEHITEEDAFYITGLIRQFYGK